ncbi:MAG: hypothetical protein ABIH20_02275 [Candidatus Diapherotrites archaeon]
MKHQLFKARNAITGFLDHKIITRLSRHRKRVRESVKEHLNSVKDTDRGKVIRLTERGNLPIYYSDYEAFLEKAVKRAIDYAEVSNGNPHMRNVIVEGIKSIHNKKFMQFTPEIQRTMRLQVYSNFMELFGEVKTGKLMNSFSSFFGLYLDECAKLQGH